MAGASIGIKGRQNRRTLEKSSFDRPSTVHSFFSFQGLLVVKVVSVLEGRPLPLIQSLALVIRVIFSAKQNDLSGVHVPHQEEQISSA